MAEVIRGLVIYAAAMVAFIVAGSVATETPLKAVAWLVLLAEVVPIATFAIGLRLSKPRKPRHLHGDWQHRGCDPVAPKLSAPEPQRVIRIERPAPKQIEAPRRELTK